MRTLSVIFLTLRLLITSAIVYNATRFLPSERRAQRRYRSTLSGARQFADFCARMGGIYFKAAQYLSTVSNVFDAEFTEIFARVSDRAEARSYEQIRYRFLKEFNAEPEQLFREFDREPAAAASLGQVHVARIDDGRKVAVKFLHPNMESIIRRDIRALNLAVRLILWFYTHLDFRSHLNEFSNMVYAEIDYENEAENMRRAADCFRDDERIIVPAVIEQFSRSTVLTTEFVEGIAINDFLSMDRSAIPRREVCELLLESYVRMFFDHRFYHADPHPGNIFVIRTDHENPIRLAFVDFGATKDVTQRTFDIMQRFIEIMRSRDVPALVDLAMEAGILSANADREIYTNLFEMIHARYASFKVDDFYRINPVRFGRIIKMSDVTYAGLRLRDMIADFKLPRNYIYLGRTITMLLSLAMRLDEKVNVFMVARPHVDRYLGARPRTLLGYLKRRGLPATLGKLLQAPGAPSRLPAARPDNTAPRLYHRLGQQALFVILAMGLFTLGLELDGRGLYDAARYSAIGGLGSLLLFLWKAVISPRASGG